MNRIDDNGSIDRVKDPDRRDEPINRNSMSNFGVAFHQLLQRIHYSGIKQYEPHNFDWFVYQPGLEPFLSWLSTHLSEENILTEDELTRYAALSNEVIENNDERQKLLDILISLENGKMAIPWTNYQRNLTEQYTCIKGQSQALKSQFQWKQQQYKSLLMKGPKLKEKVRETRRQIEHLLQLTSPQNLLALVQNASPVNQFQPVAMNFLQLERTYLSLLQNIWIDDLPLEQHLNVDLIKQLNHRTLKLVRLEVESALANVEFDTLKSQLQLCGQLKKYFESTSVDDLKKLADRLGSKSVTHQQQRSQYESQLFNVYSSRHEQALETIYLNILEKQLNNHQHLYLKQQRVLDTLQQEKHFCQLLDGMIEHRLTLIDQTSEQLNKILQYNRMLMENGKGTSAGTKKKDNNNSSTAQLDQNMPNLIEKIKSIDQDFGKNHSMVKTFLDYIHRQNDDFRPRATDLSHHLNVHLQSKITEWKNLCTSTIN